MLYHDKVTEVIYPYTTTVVPMWIEYRTVAIAVHTELLLIENDIDVMRQDDFCVHKTVLYLSLLTTAAKY